MKLWRALPLVASFLKTVSSGAVQEWNQLMLDCIVEKNTCSNIGARLLAAVHIAQWRSVQDVLKGADKKSGDVELQLQAAIASAGKAVLTELSPVDAPRAHELFQKQVGDRDGLRMGVDIGAKAAGAVLSERKGDGADVQPMIYHGQNETNKWRPTPPKYAPGFLVLWSNVTPFTMTSHDQFRSAPPPAYDSETYKKAYDETRIMGNATSSARTAEQSDAAKFWSANPEVLWAKVVQQVSANYSTAEAAKIFAVTSAASADSRIASWDAKWTYQTWRPDTAIRLGNAQNWTSDPQWLSFVETPPTPEYPSAHTATAISVAEVLRNYTGSDNFPLLLESYALPGKPRRFTSFAQATDEIGKARVWGGVHYQFSIDEAALQGKGIAIRALEVFGGPEEKPTGAGSARHLRARRLS